MIRNQSEAIKAKVINVALADDDPIFKATITKHLSVESCGIIQVLYAASDGRDLLQQLKSSTTQLPDIILLDIRMPELDGIRTAKILNEYYPKIKVIVFTEFDFESNIVEMSKVGVKSFIAKSQMSKIIRAITIVYEGGVFFSDEVGENLRKYITRLTSVDSAVSLIEPNPKFVLTPQEKRLIELLRLGKTSEEIASLMNLTVKTVRTYRERLMKKAKARNVVELLNRCL